MLRGTVGPRYRERCQRRGSDDSRRRSRSYFCGDALPGGAWAPASGQRPCRGVPASARHHGQLGFGYQGVFGHDGAGRFPAPVQLQNRSLLCLSIAFHVPETALAGVRLRNFQLRINVEGDAGKPFGITRSLPITWMTVVPRNTTAETTPTCFLQLLRHSSRLPSRASNHRKFLGYARRRLEWTNWDAECFPGRTSWQRLARPG